MCGIIGVIGPIADQSEERVAFARDIMIHRGPDDAGLDRIGPAILGFRRLAIIDLTPAGHQPMLNDDRSVGLVFNGEIYNFQELRQDLKSSYEFHSHSDTEVILKGYLEWGWEEMLRRIEGMFAIAIWDNRTRTLYGARDRVGKKPFFYHTAENGFIFSSTLNSLRALLEGTPKVNPAALDAYLTYQAVPAPLTMFEGVHQLLPAHQFVYRLDSQHLEISRYWEVNYDQKFSDKSEADVLDELDDLIHQAVCRRLVSDVPLGAFLSGGVDSSLVVGVMAAEMQEAVNAIVIGFDDEKYDERRYARQVASHLGTDRVNLTEHVLDPSSISNLPEIIWQYGQPVADVSIVPTYHVAKAARKNVTVVLNGDGGDEVFAGYARPIVAGAAQHYRQWTPGFVRSLLGRSMKSLQGSIPRAVSMLIEAGSQSAAETFIYDRALRSHRDQLYSSQLRAELLEWHPDKLYRSVWDAARATDDVDRALYGDFKTYLPDQLLTKMDVSTMAVALEARSPFLDKNLIEYAATIPTNLRIKGYTTKYLLKKLASRYVPKEVLYRRKRGFVMPTSNWMQGDLMETLNTVLNSEQFFDRGWFNPEVVRQMLSEQQTGERNWSEQLWTLLILELWARLMLDQTLSRTDTLEALS